jgi:hypothetical protein
MPQGCGLECDGSVGLGVDRVVLVVFEEIYFGWLSGSRVLGWIDRATPPMTMEPS